MSTMAPSQTPAPAPPHLHLVDRVSTGERISASEGAGARETAFATRDLADAQPHASAEHPHSSAQPEHVLVVGGAPGERLRMLEELRGLLPVSTPFLEAHETWEVLARAVGCRMVVLTGDLGDVSASSLVRLLGRRHPTLPVVSVGESTRAAHAGDVSAVSQ